MNDVPTGGTSGQPDTPPLNGAQVEKKGRFDSSDDYFISNQAD